MNKRLVLIRHGITEWNKKKRYCGSTDIGLSPKGRMQARRLRERLKGESIDGVYSSSKKRALESARIIFGDAKIYKLPALREMHFGIFEGMTFSEIMKRYPLIYKKWLRNPFKMQIAAAEEVRQVQERVIKAIQGILCLKRGTTFAVVCHGGVISLCLNHILKRHNFWKYLPDSASLTIVDFSGRKARLRLFNDTSHL